MNEIVLECKDVEFKIGKKTILQTMGFEVKKGSVFAVVGHNGAGKTTLFHLFLGLKIQTAGEIKLFGISNLECESRSKLGYVPERPYLKLEWRLREFLRFHGRLMNIGGALLDSEVERVAQEVGLRNQLDERMRTFSKGMLQKSVLAQASLGGPEFMILDEPMSGLDPEAREQVRESIQRWKKEGKTIVFSSHALEDVEQLSDRVMLLKNGAIEFIGSMEDWRKIR